MLAIAGPEGTGLPPGFSSEDVVDLGFLPAAEKRLALSACEWLVQPSQLESYSLVMMEAWQQERPCLVHALCPVTRGHVDRVGGGLYFANDAELAAVLQWGMVNPGLMRKMGRLGKQYVSNEATWDKIIPQVEQLAEQVAERAGLVEMAVV
jgi:glycosyltransferase involved in cell wall biosynthesis